MKVLEWRNQYFGYYETLEISDADWKRVEDKIIAIRENSSNNYLYGVEAEVANQFCGTYIYTLEEK